MESQFNYCDITYCPNLPHIQIPKLKTFIKIAGVGLIRARDTHKIATL
jgi:hypothetical protein